MSFNKLYLIISNLFTNVNNSLPNFISSKINNSILYFFEIKQNFLIKKNNFSNKFNYYNDKLCNFLKNKIL